MSKKQSSPHPDEQELRDFVADTLSLEAAQELAAHLPTCAECLDRAVALRSSDENESLPEDAFIEALREIDGWSAVAHGEAYLRSVVDDLLTKLSTQPIEPDTREALDAWRDELKVGDSILDCAYVNVTHAAPELEGWSSEQEQAPKPKIEFGQYRSGGIVNDVAFPQILADVPDLVLRVGAVVGTIVRLVVLVSLGSGRRTIARPYQAQGSQEWTAKFGHVPPGKYMLVTGRSRRPRT